MPFDSRRHIHADPGGPEERGHPRRVLCVVETEALTDSALASHAAECNR